MTGAGRGLFLGQELREGAGQDTTRRLLLNPDDLTTHAVCFGMTGSGKTGLCIVLLEEVIRSGIPVFMVDPKGDLANMLLTFPSLSPREFEPWIDPEQARAAGRTPQAQAEETARVWREGLAASGLGPGDVSALKEAADFVLYTPGSTAATPINVLGGFAPPPGADARMWENDPEPARSRISGTVAALLDLIEIEADPVKSPEAIFLCQLFELKWKAGETVSLEMMVRELMDPAPTMRKMGAMDTETMLPRPRRTQIAMALNTLIAAPAFSAWTRGEPLDIERMARSGGGSSRPRASVIYLAHLSDKERSFFVATFLQALITWMRAQPGTSSLRALFYMDEIFGYFPPLSNPPAKQPLLTLLKQARAFGLGAVLATQNPVDVDYKGLSNAGIWFLGKLQTERDRARLLDGLSGTSIDRAAVEGTLASLPPRKFILHNVHDPGLKRFTTRWAMSYLRGPLTREEVKRLAAPQGTAPGGPPPAAVLPSTAREEGRVVRESAPAGIPESFLPAAAGTMMIPALRARTRVAFVQRAAGLRELSEEEIYLPLDPASTPGSLDWNRAGKMAEAVSPDPPTGVFFADLPDEFRAASAYRQAVVSLKSHLASGRVLALLRNERLKLQSRPGEGPESFRGRCLQEARRRRDEELSSLKGKYEEKIRRLQARVDKELRELERDKQALSGRQMDELVNAGEMLLGMFLGGGRRRSITTVASRRRMTAGSGAQVEKSQAEFDAARDELEQMSREAESALSELETRWEQEAANIVEVPVRPGKSDVEVVELGLFWLPRTNA